MSEHLEIPKQPDSAEAVVLKLADAMFRGALWWAVGTVAVGVLVAGLWVGWTGVFGALVGGLVGCLSSFATLLLMRKTAKLSPHMLFAVVMAAFVGKMFLLLITMLLLGGVDFLHRESLAVTMLATVVVSAATEVMAFQRTKVPTIIPKTDG
jgi:ATP synthase protein I